MIKKLLTIFFTGLIAVFALSSCQSTSTGEVNSQTPVSSETSGNVSSDTNSADNNEQTPEKGVLNPLTGEYNLAPSAEGKRFYSLMLGNSNEGLPQLGTSKADMIYEMMVEGGITRMMAVYADVASCGSTPIGSNRSARTNFVSTAMGYDCIFGHYGGSESGYGMIKNNKVNDLDGIALSKTFWRDADRKKNGIEHSALTSGEKLVAAAEKKGYRTERKNKDYTAFSFNRDGDISANGETSAAAEVSAKFSNYMTSKFEYDSATGNYKKFRNKKAHVDGNTNKQLEFKNVIVITDKHGYEEDGYHVVVEQKNGSGYYFCDGKAVKIKWSKGELSSPYKYTKADGSDLLLTPGKTYVCVIPSGKGSVSYS